MSKFWNHVEERLITRTGNMYFMGGTLSVGLSKDSGVALNLNGKGFVFGKIKTIPCKEVNDRVYLPQHITDLVRQIYLDVKGETEHYRESVFGEITSTQKVSIA